MTKVLFGKTVTINEYYIAEFGKRITCNYGESEAKEKLAAMLKRDPDAQYELVLVK